MWTNPQFSADLVTDAEEILNGKRHFLCSDYFLVRLALGGGRTFYLQDSQIWNIPRKDSPKKKIKLYTINNGHGFT